ncbi:MAG TPA: DoxX family protein [Acidobacteriaceae bacterium]|nr:DoxX family protein [Acidobacteriaceae bacterium]
MAIAYLVVAVLLAAMTFFSGVGKLRHDPSIVKAIHETCRIPMRYFPFLAACEMAGATGVVLGIWWPPLGVAGAAGLVLYFLGAVASHLRVGDSRGIGPAAFLLSLSVAALVLRLFQHGSAL